MGLLGKDSITITDITDVNPIRLDLASSQPIYQTKRASGYEPDYTSSPLIITPSLYFGQEEVNREKYIDKITFYINGVLVVNTETIYVENTNLYIKENLNQNIKVEAVIENIIDERTKVNYERVSESLSFYLLSYDSSGYTAFIDSDNGRYDFSSANSSPITLRAHLYLGSTELTDVSYEWKRSSNSSEIYGNTKSITIQRADIYSHENFICSMTCEEVSYVATCAIDDRTDLYTGAIISDATLVMTPSFNSANLSCKIFKNGEEVNSDGASENFEYSWIYYKNETTEGISIGNTKNIHIELGKVGNPPKDNFTLYCITTIDNKYTVVSFLPISYSVSYSPIITPKTIFIPSNADGSYKGTETEINKVLSFFLQGEDGIPIDADLTPISISGLTSTAVKENNKYSISFSLSLNAFKQLDISSMFEVSYTYKGHQFNEEFYIVKSVQGEAGENGSSYSLILSNDFHRFAGKEVYAIGEQKVSTNISFFKGDEEIPIEVIKIGSLEGENIKTTPEYVTIGLQANVNQIGFSTGKEITFTTIDRALKDGGTLPIEIKVNLNGKEQVFATVFNYEINYEGNAYFLSFLNGTSVSYLPSKDSFTPDKIEFYAYYRKNGSGENILYTDGKVYVSIDGGIKTKLSSTSAFYSYPISNSIKNSLTFYLYNSIANDSNPEDAYLMDREIIPILTSLEGAEIGGDNLLKFSRTFEAADNRWIYKYGFSDEIAITKDNEFNVLNFNFAYKDATSSDSPNNGSCYVISPPFFIDEEVINKDLCFSIYFKINSSISEAKKSGNKIYFSLLGYSSSDSLIKESDPFSFLDIRIEDDNILENGKWIRLYEVFKGNILQNSTIKYFKIKICGLIDENNTSTHYNFYIKKPKLEIGNTPTAWCMASNDIILEELNLDSVSLGSGSIVDILKQHIANINSNSNNINSLINGSINVSINNPDGTTSTFTKLEDLSKYLNESLNRVIELQKSNNEVINNKYDTLALSLDKLYKFENKIEMGYDNNNLGKPYLLFDAAGGLSGKKESHQMKLTTERLSFLYNNNELAYFGSKSMTISKARVNQGIYLGTPSSGYLLIKTTEQGCAFIWEESFDE